MPKDKMSEDKDKKTKKKAKLNEDAVRAPVVSNSGQNKPEVRDENHKVAQTTESEKNGDGFTFQNLAWLCLTLQWWSQNTNADFTTWNDCKNVNFDDVSIVSNDVNYNFQVKNFSTTSPDVRTAIQKVLVKVIRSEKVAKGSILVNCFSLDVAAKANDQSVMENIQGRIDRLMLLDPTSINANDLENRDKEVKELSDKLEGFKSKNYEVKTGIDIRNEIEFLLREFDYLDSRIYNQAKLSRFDNALNPIWKSTPDEYHKFYYAAILKSNLAWEIELKLFLDNQTLAFEAMVDKIFERVGIVELQGLETLIEQARTHITLLKPSITLDSSTNTLALLYFKMSLRCMEKVENPSDDRPYKRASKSDLVDWMEKPPLDSKTLEFVIQKLKSLNMNESPIRTYIRNNIYMLEEDTHAHTFASNLLKVPRNRTTTENPQN